MDFYVEYIFISYKVLILNKQWIIHSGPMSFKQLPNKKGNKNEINKYKE